MRNKKINNRCTKTKIDTEDFKAPDVPIVEVVGDTPPGIIKAKLAFVIGITILNLSSIHQQLA